MKALTMLPTWIPIFFLCLLCPVRAAFTGLTCDAAHDICVEASPNGAVCFYSNLSTTNWACPVPFNLPLQTHLSQEYSIAYYNPTGSFLGNWNYSLAALVNDTIYVCMSARVNSTSSQYFTLCAQAIGDENWQGGGCEIDLVPANPIDGCYSGPTTSAPILSPTPTPMSSSVSSSSITPTPTHNSTSNNGTIITNIKTNNTPVIVGGVVGGLIGFGLLAILAFLLVRRGNPRPRNTILDAQQIPRTTVFTPNAAGTFIPNTLSKIYDPDDPTTYPSAGANAFNPYRQQSPPMNYPVTPAYTGNGAQNTAHSQTMTQSNDGRTNVIPEL